MLKHFFRKLLSTRINGVYISNHKKELIRFCESAGVTLSKRGGETDFINKWKPIYANVNVDFYRFYANFCGEDANILSDDIYHTVVEPILNDQAALTVYGNKNMYELLMNRDIFPICILRNIDGDFMDRDYHVISMNEDEFAKRITSNERVKKLKKIICKPTTDTSGGNGVHLYRLRDDGRWINDEGQELSLAHLTKVYKKDFILQECVNPSAFVKQFNETSFSTLRIFTYRSVKDDAIHFIGGYLRVGAKGSFKDNVWGGGYACPIKADGTLAKFATDSQRKRYDNINGISLTENTFEIPNFDKVMELVTYVAKKNVPNRLLSFDIILDEANIPHVIEFNIKNQTVTTVQTSGKTFFGEFTDEVIDYCKIRRDKIKYSMIL